MVFCFIAVAFFTNRIITFSRISISLCQEKKLWNFWNYILANSSYHFFLHSDNNHHKYSFLLSLWIHLLMIHRNTNRNLKWKDLKINLNAATWCTQTKKFPSKKFFNPNKKFRILSPKKFLIITVKNNFLYLHRKVKTLPFRCFLKMAVLFFILETISQSLFVKQFDFTLCFFFLYPTSLCKLLKFLNKTSLKETKCFKRSFFFWLLKHPAF